MTDLATSKCYQPYLIAINLTRRCNLMCRHCYLDARIRQAPDVNELTTAELEPLFEDIAKRAKGTLIVLTGGEPLLREDIYALIAAGSSRGLRMVLGTNGLFIDSGVAARLRQTGLQGVGVSLDSISPLDHDAFRGVPGAWRRAVAAIEACRAVDLHVQLHTMLRQDNVTQIPSFVSLAQDLDVALVNFFFLVCTGRGQHLSDITPQQYEKALHTIARIQSATARPMVQVRCAPHFKRILYQIDPASPYTRAQGYDGGGCLAATHYCRIDPMGNVTPCPYLEIVAGNLRQSSFWTIWDESPLFAGLRTPRRTGRCGNCEFQALCGGCRARALARYEDVMAEDPSCIWEPGPERAPVEVPLNKPPADGLWAPEAKERLQRVPPFLRDRIRRRLEEKALEEDTIITPEFMAAYRKQREQELGLQFTGASDSTTKSVPAPPANACPREKDHV